MKDVCLRTAAAIFRGRWRRGADFHPLIPAAEYTGPEPRRYTYEGREACYRGEVGRLGPNVVFLASDATVDEWRLLLRAMYVDGGWFTRQAIFGSFLTENTQLAKTPNGQEALRLEHTGDLFCRCKVEIQALLAASSPSGPAGNQLDFGLRASGEGAPSLTGSRLKQFTRGDVINFPNHLSERNLTTVRS
jgi:hypothetical protein